MSGTLIEDLDSWTVVVAQQLDLISRVGFEIDVDPRLENGKVVIYVPRHYDDRACAEVKASLGVFLRRRGHLVAIETSATR